MDFGAINKQTLQYVLPYKGTKSHKYICPDCNKDLILCKGKIIKKAYFRHKYFETNVCNYFIYDKKIKIIKYCVNCNKYNISKLYIKSDIKLKYNIKYNIKNNYVDFINLKNNKIVNTYEICKTSKIKNENIYEKIIELNDIDEMNNIEIFINKYCCKKCENCKIIFVAIIYILVLIYYLIELFNYITT